MKLKAIGKTALKVAYFYALYVVVDVMGHALYEISRGIDSIGYWGEHPENKYWDYPSMWVANIAGRYTTWEQTLGFGAMFIVFGIIAIVAKNGKNWRGSKTRIANSEPR